MAKSDDVLVLELAGGSTVGVAARKAGIGRTTAHRRLNDPAFRKRVDQARSELWERATAILAKTSVESAIVLRKLLRSDSEKTQLQAARIILEAGPRMRDQTELAERLRVLEEQVSNRKANR